MEFIPSLLSPSDPHKPSLFELLSEAQLNALLPPSLRYILALLTHRYPRYLIRILNNFDEVYAVVSIVVEKYFLETFGGGFTENFYGLKRERVLNVKGGEIPRAGLGVPAEVNSKLRISNRRGDVWKNLFVMVGIPYLKRKLDESYDVHIAPSAGLVSAAPSVGLGGGMGGPQYVDRDALPPNATAKQRIMWAYKWFLRHVYPSVNAAYYFSILAFSLGYLFDGTKYSSPFLWMASTRIRRMGEADYRAIEEASKASIAAATASTGAGRPGQGLAGIFHPRTLWPRLLSSLRLFLPTSIFALKFLEWWHASDFSRQLTRKAAEGLELPPPIVSGMGLAQKQNDDKSNPSSLSSTNQQTQHAPSQPANHGSKRDPPISSTTYLPILTVPPPPSSDLCPICLHPIETAAACQTGFVYDFKCIFQWVDGTHERQEAWMRGDDMNEWVTDETAPDNDDGNGRDEPDERSQKVKRSRVGEWESGKGRCAVTGRRVLGDTSGIRRIMV